MKKEFHIKNMVCRSCITIIATALKNNGLKLESIELGKVVVETENISKTKVLLLTILRNNDFDLIETPEDKLVEQIKILLIQLIASVPDCINVKVSEYLVGKLHQEYSTMSKLFSYNQQITIEKYFIKLKVEKVKELIHSQKYNFTEMSQILGYSNLGHLSAQFKTETGMSLTQYKSLNLSIRNPLNRII
jgi:AraC-like DNA-binding protein